MGLRRLLRHWGWGRAAVAAEPASGRGPGEPPAFFDISWLAVRGAPHERVLSALDLSDPRPASWRQGYRAVWGDSWDLGADLDAPLSRVFISPLVDGWRLVVGGALGACTQANRIEGVKAWCERLSREFGDACAYTTQGRMDWYSWVLARDGRVYRSFLWEGQVTAEFGTRAPAELEDTAGRPAADWRPSETLVMAIAAQTSLDCSQLDSPALQRRQGWLATTAWGRAHGTPARALEPEGEDWIGL